MTSKPVDPRKEKIVRLLTYITANKLEYPDSLAVAPLTSIVKVYNGCGPEFLASRYRALLTKFYSIFEPAFLVHDWDYETLPSTVEHFRIANRRMYVNMLTIANSQSPWFRWFWKVEARRLYDICSRFGWASFYNKRGRL